MNTCHIDIQVIVKVYITADQRSTLLNGSVYNAHLDGQRFQYSG